MAVPRYIPASQVPPSTRYIRASQVPARAPLPASAPSPPNSGFNLGDLGAGLGSLGSLARLAPGATGVGAGLGLLGNIAGLANLFRSGNPASTPRKVLGGASNVAGGISNANQLAGALGVGTFLSPSVAGRLGAAGGLLGIGSGALGLAEGGGPESAAQIASGTLALLGLGGPASLFAVPAFLGPLMGGPGSQRDDPRRGVAGAAETASLLAPIGEPNLARFLAHPQLSQAASIADFMNRGGANDLRLSPIPEAHQFVEQLRAAQGAGHNVPRWSGPQNLEALSFVGGAPKVFAGLSKRLSELGFPFTGPAFAPPIQTLVPGSPIPETSASPGDQYVWQADVSGRPYTAAPLWTDLGNITRAQLDQYRPAYDEQLTAGGTTAPNFDAWAARQLARNRGILTGAETYPVQYRITG